MSPRSETKRKFHVPTPEEDAAIAAGIAADPDTHEVGAAEFVRMKRVGRPPKLAALKVSTTVRLDADVLEGLRATGRGWQTRVNSALRAWLKKHPPERRAG